MEEVSFRAEDFAGQTVTIDAPYVDERLSEIAQSQDLSRFIL